MRIAPEPIQKKLRKGARELSSRDPIMAELVRKVGPITWKLHEDPFQCLVVQIINQVISSKAADTVEARLRAFTEHQVRPEVLIRISQEEFRSLGIGKQKYGYIQNLAEAFLAQPGQFQHLDEMEDAAVIKILTGLKGIGKWTAQMFLMFALGRMDIFAPDDLVLFNASRKFYFPESDPGKKEIAQHAEIWAPWRSVASLYLWKGYHLQES